MALPKRFNQDTQDEGLSGTEYLASIYGTELDKINCSFYFKIGACRHGENCCRTHLKPTLSQTILLKNFYVNPFVDIRRPDAFEKVMELNDEEQRYFDEFYEEVYTEMENKYGSVNEIHVCENIAEHMVGNTYVKFYREEDAQKALADLDNRWFNGQPIYVELSPVTNFRESRCRQHEMKEGCNKGGFCNFMHLKKVSSNVLDRLRSSRRRGRGSDRYERRRSDDRGRYSRYRRSRDRSDSRYHRRSASSRRVKNEKRSDSRYRDNNNRYKEEPRDE